MSTNTETALGQTEKARQVAEAVSLLERTTATAEDLQGSLLSRLHSVLIETPETTSDVTQPEEVVVELAASIRAVTRRLEQLNDRIQSALHSLEL